MRLKPLLTWLLISLIHSFSWSQTSIATNGGFDNWETIINDDPSGSFGILEVPIGFHTYFNCQVKWRKTESEGNPGAALMVEYRKPNAQIPSLKIPQKIPIGEKSIYLSIDAISNAETSANIQFGITFFDKNDNEITSMFKLGINANGTITDGSIQKQWETFSAIFYNSREFPTSATSASFTAFFRNKGAKKGTKIWLDNFTALEDVSLMESPSLFENYFPVKKILSTSFLFQNKQQIKIYKTEVININGQIISSKDNSGRMDEILVNIPDVKGIYLIVLYNEHGRFVKKIVV